MCKYLFYFDSNAYGGAEKYLFELIKYLMPDNEVKLICAHPEVVNANPSFNDIPLIVHKISNLFDVKAILDLRKLIKLFSPDLMFFNMHVPFSCQYAIIAALGTLKRSRLVAMVHHPLKMISKFPLVGNIRMIVSTCLLNKFGTIICPSEAAKHLLVTNYKLQDDRLTIINLGVEMPKGIDIMKRSPQVSGSKTIGVVSRLVREKGLELMIDAFADILKLRHDVKLTIIGEGYLGKALKEKVQALNISNNVVFTGYVADPLPLISSFDVFVLPSLFETFPYALLEAMSLSRPIVATRVGGIPEIIDDQCSILVPPGDKKALANAIIRLLDDEKLAEKLGENAFLLFKAKYQKTESLKRFATTLSRIAERGSSE